MYRTFDGFLRAYCKELSGMNTANLRRLCVACAADAPRLAEPLFLLAAQTGKLDYLMSLSVAPWMLQLWKSARAELDLQVSLIQWLESGSAPKRFEAVLLAWRGDADLLQADRRIAGLLRTRILKSLKENGVTRYRMCEDLKLNKGNVYAFLAGDDAKLSIEAVRKLDAYAAGLKKPLE